MKNLSRTIGAFFIFMLLGFTASAQNTTISATVVDSDTTVWAGGSWIVQFVPNPSYPSLAQYNINGVPLTSAQLKQNGTMDGSGILGVTVPTSSTITPQGSSWRITTCPLASSGCGTTIFTATGGSQDISSSINASITSPRFNAVSGSYGYIDTEAILTIPAGGTYYNVTTPCQRIYSGSSWTCLGAGGGGGGTVTEVGTVSPLFGGPITGSGNISCPTCIDGTVGSTNYALGTGPQAVGAGALSDNGTQVTSTEPVQVAGLTTGPNQIYPEQTACTGSAVTGQDNVCANPSTHTLQGTMNGDALASFVRSPDGIAAGHCKMYAANGVDDADAGAACGAGSSAVTSVANSDGTLTISPTTGTVVASLALGHPNTWGGTQTIPLGTASSAVTQTVGDNTSKVATDAFVLANASSGSAGIVLHGLGVPAAGTPATMTHVQSSPANATTTFSSNVTSANLLVCSEQGESFYTPMAIPTDTVGTLYRSVSFYQNTGVIANQIWIGRAGGTGANTVTTNNSGTSVVISCDEFSAGTALVDVIAVPSINTLTPSTSVTTQTAGELLYASWTLPRTGGTPTFTAGSGLTLGVNFGGNFGLSQNPVASAYALGASSGSHTLAITQTGGTIASDANFVGIAIYASATGGCTNGNFYVNDTNNQTWGPCISGAIAPSGALQPNGNDVQFVAAPFINPGPGNATTIDGIPVTGAPLGAGYSIITDAANKASWHPSLAGGTTNALVKWTGATSQGNSLVTDNGQLNIPETTNIIIPVAGGAGLAITQDPSNTTSGLGITINTPGAALILTDTESGSGDNTGGAIGFDSFNLGGSFGLTRTPEMTGTLGNGFSNILATWYANSSSNPVWNLFQGSDFGWSNGSSGSRGPIDTGISRDSAGVIDFGNGTHQDTTATIQAAQIVTAAIRQQGPSNYGGTCSMSTSTSCTITIGHTYTTPVCAATQQSSTLTGGAVGCTVSGTTVTITSAVPNSETWGALVFGNPN